MGRSTGTLTRKEQARATRKTIYRAAVRQLRAKGYDGTNIRNICAQAGVSVGTFYLYYTSKDDILIEMLHKRWKKEERNLPPIELKPETNIYPIIEQLMGNWAHAFGNYTFSKDTSLNLPAHFFHRHVISKDSPFFRRLHHIVSHGQEYRQLSPELEAEEICWKLIRFGRGIVFDWSLNEGEYDLHTFLKQELRFFWRLFER